MRNVFGPITSAVNNIDNIFCKRNCSEFNNIDFTTACYEHAKRPNKFQLNHSNGFYLCSCYLLLSTLLPSCVDPYSPPALTLADNILVVDGYMNSSNNSAIVKLTRAISLTDDQSYPVESNAIVSIESSSNSIFTLIETKSGTYETTGMNINAADQYRLRIQTIGGSEYLSDYITLRQAPTIDNIEWVPEEEGITIHLNTHDVSGNTRYYQWIYHETWEYRSDFNSMVYLNNGEVFQRPEAESIYTCWQTQQSSKILISSTTNLSEDRVNDFELTAIERGSKKISREYSILVQQRALSEEAYNFWFQLQQTNENVGGLFDPLPSQVTGNIYNVNNTSEPVLGYFNGGSVQEKRIFINFYDLPDHLKYVPRSACVLDSIPLDRIKTLSNTTLLVTGYGDTLEGYLSSTIGCIDCRYYGGVTTKPDFWP